MAKFSYLLSYLLTFYNAMVSNKVTETKSEN